jgi:putative membrane protein
MGIFIDILTSQLISIGFAGLLVVYLAIEGYLAYKHKEPLIEKAYAASIPLLIVGLYIFITGLYSQFIWPLPGSYNILFYDIYTLLGVIVLALAFALKYKSELHYIGFIALLFGFFVIYYGYIGYSLGMTSAPLGMLAMYSLFGIGSIASYPLTLAYDKIMEKKKFSNTLDKFFLAVFVLAIIIASLIAFFIVFSAIPIHLMKAP